MLADHITETSGVRAQQQTEADELSNDVRLLSSYIGEVEK